MKDIEYSAAMAILRASSVFAPALVRYGGRFHIFSRTTELASGETMLEALEAGGFLPPPAMPPPYVAVKDFVTRGGKDRICIARSHTAALRIANALNEYTPGDRGF